MPREFLQPEEDGNGGSGDGEQVDVHAFYEGSDVYECFQVKEVSNHGGEHEHEAQLEPHVYRCGGSEYRCGEGLMDTEWQGDNQCR